MIGQATASLALLPRRLLVRLWGHPHIETRQKWNALWPYLSRLSEGPLRVLDAGCGDGSWSLELAARRPRWFITGVDRAELSVRVAELARRCLALRNVVFVQRDFLEFHPADAFDVVLSVASAHYLVEHGRGEELFRAFGAWLKPNGFLLLFGPRCQAEVPCSPWLPAPFYLRDVISLQAMQALCRAGGLEIEVIAPVIGALATLANQVARAAEPSRALSVLSYPLRLTLSALDRLSSGSNVRQPSSAWLLLARRPIAHRRNLPIGRLGEARDDRRPDGPGETD